MDKLLSQIRETIGAAETTRRERLLSPKDFLQLTADEVDRANRYDRPLALAMMVIDGLVMLRKAEGCAVATAATNRAIDRVMEMLRKPDRIAQLGPAELGIIMPETTLKNAAAVCERLRSGADVSRKADDTRHDMTVSIGVAALSPRMRDPKRFLMAGCFELRRAQSRGGNKVCVATAEPVRLSIPRSGQIH